MYAKFRLNIKIVIKIYTNLIFKVVIKFAVDRDLLFKTINLFKCKRMCGSKFVIITQSNDLSAFSIYVLYKNIYKKKFNIIDKMFNVI